MKCPKCGSYQVKVIDSRPVEVGRKRRYSCLNCGNRFNTIEQAKRAHYKKQEDFMEETYSVIEAADLLGIKVRTVREWIRLGKIKAYKLKGSNRWTIYRSEIERIRGIEYGCAHVNTMV